MQIQLRNCLKIKNKFLKFQFKYMKFHMRIVQIDILLELNKYTCKNSPIFLVKSKTEFLQWLKEYITV